MITYKYTVTDFPSDAVSPAHETLKERTFDTAEEALDYAKNGLVTFITRDVYKDGVLDEEASGEVVWSWDSWDTDENMLARIKAGEIDNDMSEDFSIEITKTPNNTTVRTSGDDTQELMGFARAILGDNYEAFDCDFIDCVDDEQEYTNCAPAEFNYETEEDEPIEDGEVNSAEDARVRSIEEAITKNPKDFSTPNCILEITDSDFGWESEDCWVVISVSSKDGEKNTWIKVDGVDADSLDFDTETDTWDDPGDYPSGAGGGPLSSYNYTVVTGANLSVDKNSLDYQFEDEDGNLLTDEQAKEILSIDDNELKLIVSKAKKIAFVDLESMADNWASDYSDEIVDKYDLDSHDGYWDDVDEGLLETKNKKTKCNTRKLACKNKVNESINDFEVYDFFMKDNPTELEEASSSMKKAFKNGGEDIADQITGKAIARIKDPKAKAAAVAAKKAGRNDVVKQFTGDRKENQASGAYEKKAAKMQKAGYNKELDESAESTINKVIASWPEKGLEKNTAAEFINKDKSNEVYYDDMSEDEFLEAFGEKIAAKHKRKKCR